MQDLGLPDPGVPDPGLPEVVSTPRVDALLWRFPTGESRLWELREVRKYKEVSLGFSSNDWQPVTTGDFTGDGWGDILWGHRTKGTGTLWSMKRTRVGSTQTGTTQLPAGSRAFVGDLDGDGTSEIAWTTTTTQYLPFPVTLYRQQIWTMGSGTTTPKSISASASAAEQLQAIGNFGGDNRADLLYRVPATGAVVVAVSGGERISVNHVPGNDWVIKGVGNFDHNPTSDVLWYNTISGGVSIWPMSEGQPTALQLMATIPPEWGWSIIAVADADRDGVSDIVWRHTSGQLAFWYMADPFTMRDHFEVDLPPDVKFGGALDLGRSGELSALTYNVNGLPHELHAEGDPKTNTPLIGRLLNDFDLALVQEDWDGAILGFQAYHNLLDAEAHHPYRSIPAANPNGADLLRPDAYGSDGLNEFSNFPFAWPGPVLGSGAVARITWKACSSTQYLDCYSLKGFTVASHRLETGVDVHVYNLHADAGTTAADIEAKRNNFVQLAQFIQFHSAGHPIILGGDTNLHTEDTGQSHEAEHRDIWQTFRDTTGLQDACLGSYPKAPPYELDKFAFRSGGGITLEPVSCVFNDWRREDGMALSGDDHMALNVKFRWLRR